MGDSIGIILLSMSYQTHKHSRVAFSIAQWVFCQFILEFLFVFLESVLMDKGVLKT